MKGKVGPMHAIMVYMKSGGVASFLLNLDSRRKSVVSLMPRPHYLRGKIKICNKNITLKFTGFNHKLISRAFLSF